MGLQGTLRAMEAAERRQQRDIQRRQREAERRTKEQAKRSALEQARYEVEDYERRMALLQSVHKDCGEPWDWLGVVTCLPPPPPVRAFHNEKLAQQQVLVSFSISKSSADHVVEQARKQDEHDYRTAQEAHLAKVEQQEKLRTLGSRIL